MPRDAHLLLLAALAACQEYSIYDPLAFQASSNPPALTATPKTDVIRQGVSPAVDVLWVLDDSGSMGEEQQKLAENLNAFYDYLNGSGLDWHIGVITTDTDSEYKAGKLINVAGYPFLAQQVPYNEDLFPMMVRVGTGGAADERGLYAAWLALAQPSSDLRTHNAGFYRENASLHVVVVSDEEDQSHDFISTYEFSSFLATLKSDPEATVTFSSIVGPSPGGCSTRDTTADHGARYISVTTQVGGIHASICEDDWVPILEELGLQASGQRQEFFLSEVPDPESLQVAVVTPRQRWKGVPVVAVADVDAACAAAGADQCVGYRYDTFRNSIVLLGFVPGRLAEVRITYDRLGGVR